MNPIRVLMILPDKLPILERGIDLNLRFWMDALHRSRSLDIAQIICDKRMDLSDMILDCDILLFPYITTDLASRLHGVKDAGIPVVANSGDPHNPKRFDMPAIYERLNIVLSYDRYDPSSFYKYYSKNHRYETVVWGLDPSLYANLRPYEERIPTKIVISGLMPDAPGFARRAFRKYVRKVPPELIAWNHYRLRTLCNKLPYVIHTQTIHPGQNSLDLPAILSLYRAGIAATTSITTHKYVETPAAGCLTFMEITEENGGKCLGYEDGKSAIFIDETNYKSRLKEYLDSPFDPKWQRIAMAGQKHTMEHLTNDNAADRLAVLMRKLLDGELE